MKKKKISKSKKEELVKERVEKLKTSLDKKLKKFSSNHIVYMSCYPSGIKMNSKREIVSTFFQQHIYICKNLCQKPCEFFIDKTYLCREIGCTYYPVCFSKSSAARKKICKSKNLLKERKYLNKLYNRYLYLMAVHRGLKIDPKKTLKYLDYKKKKEKNSGKISNSKNRKKGKRVKKRTGS